VRVASPTGKLFVTTLINLTQSRSDSLAACFTFIGAIPAGSSGGYGVHMALHTMAHTKPGGCPTFFDMIPDRRPLSSDVSGYALFLPEHNGIQPDTLHVFFDVVTIAILIDLAILTS
jgi:hypothetical protein